VAIASDPLGGEEFFDHADDVLLAVTRKLANLLENETSFTNGATFALGLGFNAEQFVGRYPEGGSEFGNVFGAQGSGAAFPSGVGLLRDAHFIGHLVLGKAETLADGDESFPERGAFKFGRSSFGHVGRIRAITVSGLNSLHDYKQYSN
jgi:hypothetical protein